MFECFSWLQLLENFIEINFKRKHLLIIRIIKLIDWEISIGKKKTKRTFHIKQTVLIKSITGDREFREPLTITYHMNISVTIEVDKNDLQHFEFMTLT